MTNPELYQLALKARENSYAPYSGFKVGAALLCDSGKVFIGCNIENAAYSPGICAERVAFASAISAGERKFLSIAVASGGNGQCMPCGVCRQTFREFCDPVSFFVVALASGDPERYTQYTLEELLPYSFGNESLQEG
ncbi:MAG: cytidine deaminase [Oscillospiraceae bacterium]|nr:cytidine deaminase [Oscillospiraceae bacterium]